jgi:hypothetical protein
LLAPFVVSLLRTPSSETTTPNGAFGAKKCGEADQTSYARFPFHREVFTGGSEARSEAAEFLQVFRFFPSMSFLE